MLAIDYGTNNLPRLISTLFSLLVCSSTVLAQDDAVAEIEVTRDARELGDLIAEVKPLPDPVVAPLLDTALIFTSIDDRESWVHCTATRFDGSVSGRVRVHLPATGVRFVLASDFVDERGWLGSVRCSARGWTTGTQIMLGALSSDVDVLQDSRSDTSSMLFTMVATR